ncbi:MAG: HAD-IB family phosphatase [Candidatus Doudnabacteria bacterium]|nr:HAD-IB family phosphatase [Candidatus Doudnabacteria bacterium]
MRPIAIFDIDGTIFRSSLTIELFKHLVRRKIFSADFMAKVRRSEEKWMNRQGHYDDYVFDVVESYRKAIIGKRKDAIVAASREVIAEQKFRTYRYTLSLLRRIRKKYFTIGISGSPLEVVNEYNKFLKFDKLYGWEFGLDEKGRYTKVVLHVPPEYKKELIVRFVQNHRLSLTGSIGIGDTQSDVGFLELVSTPIAFNPNWELAEIARKRNWTIVLERKDLIVEFQPKKVKFLKR